MLAIKEHPLISSAELQSLIESTCEDIFALLGPHRWNETQHVVRVFLPGAESVTLVDRNNAAVLKTMEQVKGGVFVGLVDSPNADQYQLSIQYPGQLDVREDIYRFGTTLKEMDLYLFGERLKALPE